MTFTPETTVAEVVVSTPTTIPLFQKHQIDFCCGGRASLATACHARGLDVETVLGELRALADPALVEASWANASLGSLIAHIQRRFHEPLRAELPRLAEMLEKVTIRHGDRLGGTIQPLRRAFTRLQMELLAHMAQEEDVLFPFVVALETGVIASMPSAADGMASLMTGMEHVHVEAASLLMLMRDLTDGYRPPTWAGPSIKELYRDLGQFESEMQVHVHLENNVLFPGTERLARGERLRPPR